CPTRNGAPNHADALLGAPGRPDRCDRVANSLARKPSSGDVDAHQDLAALLDAEQGGGAPPRDRDGAVSVAVLVEDELALRRVGEGAGGDGVVAAAARGELDAHARHDARGVEMLAREVERDVPEAVDAEHDGADESLTDLGLRQLEPDEGIRGERRPQLAGRDAAREMRRRRREEIAAVERA